ncbi:sugar-binding transcriptional regulator [Levilactobacillus brevis]|mgnify:CR=1 FL=1|uniref:Central glycolytic protein regulator n=1 Tax=Levilactobacillus brevis TaxID=1580 RepID=A0A0D0FET4_LEVBR|nr:sugar-binding domain-containing protein [Levilactobacillus brevis]ARN92072.1 SorC family transcriptional regulator [Levilactobacillus brevis]ARN94771.1 SorC family transcriptional regulator [Levilactobacillus brevis]KIO95103.1 Central glycolytic genes regulator [Levilactobacillus brevis]MCZ2119583.1 sugar-binding domain-containing protein [Levilactobacillus brevis]MCZ2125066.1 sugar-binding domain-containing protein [Levilactobacillus brevis]
MHEDWQWVEAIMPQMVTKLTSRFRILQGVANLQPVGRRTLATNLACSERTVRTTTDALAGLGYIQMSVKGMQVTAAGQRVLQGLAPVMNDLAGRQQREQTLAQRLGIAHCTIVPGDSTAANGSLNAMAQAANRVLTDEMPTGHSTVAVMGGHTLAAVAQVLTPALSINRQLLFVPARGGVGESPAIQANTVAAEMAQQTNSDFRQLYVPEQLTTATYKPLFAEPAIHEVLQLIGQSNVVIHGIGQAFVMAKRRKMAPHVIADLAAAHAVGEAFGYFYDAEGHVVSKFPRIGLEIGDLAAKQLVIAVAGGAEKGTAIAAYMRLAPAQTWLITDEGAADFVLKK